MQNLLLVLAVFCCVSTLAAAEPHLSIRLVAPAQTSTLAVKTGDEVETAVPAIPFSLKQNTPDPFDSTTTIPFVLYEAVPVRLEILNEAGDTVVVLVDAVLEAGEYSMTFDASELPGGLYYYRLVSGMYNSMRNMTKNTTTDVSGYPDKSLLSLSLFPNPSSGELRICFTPLVAGSITIDLFSVDGQHTTTLFNGYCDAREQSLLFSLDTVSGVLLPAGQYWCRVVSPDGTAVVPLMLVR